MFNNSVGRVVKMNLPQITPSLVKSLISEQFPHWSHLTITPIEIQGWDNRTYRLGSDMIIRLPSAKEYALQIPKEQKWLSILSLYLSYSTPIPLALGQPSKGYPWQWSIYNWIDGISLDKLNLTQSNIKPVARSVAKFLNELHKIDVKDGPLPGIHNYWRGAHPEVCDNEVRSSIGKLGSTIDAKKALNIWEAALNSHWPKDPVWIHGDLLAPNILMHNGKVNAVIDFGCMAIGDPACDLMLAWTLMDASNRKIFRDSLDLDDDTWNRAQGWSLWKATLELSKQLDPSSQQALFWHKTIENILN